MTHVCYLGIGSNISPDTNVRAGLDALNALFNVAAVSRAFESAALGFDGAPFLNLVVQTESALSLAKTIKQLREIEYQYGRPPDCSKYSSRTLDIDLLMFDNLAGHHNGVLLPRAECTHNAFVLRPFAELCPTLVLPGQTHTLATLWRNYAENQTADPVDFNWGARKLPYNRDSTLLANLS